MKYIILLGDGMAGLPVTYINTGDSHGGRFGTGIQSITSYIPGNLAQNTMNGTNAIRQGTL